MVWDVRLQQPVKIVRLGSCERVSTGQSEDSRMAFDQSEDSILYIDQSEDCILHIDRSKASFLIIGYD